MKSDRTRVIAKLLEAVGIAATMLGLVQGLYGDMWGELYLFIGGIAVFVIGRVMEKRWESAQKAGETGTRAGPDRAADQGPADLSA